MKLKEIEGKSYSLTIFKKYRSDEDELKKQLRKKETKKEIKEYLDKQVEEKKIIRENDKYINDAQGILWRTDSILFKEQEHDISKKVSLYQI